MDGHYFYASYRGDNNYRIYDILKMVRVKEKRGCLSDVKGLYIVFGGYIGVT